MTALEILKSNEGKWSPALTTIHVLESIRQLLRNPDLEERTITVNGNVHTVPINKIAKIYKNDNAKFEETARKWTKKYAMGM